MNHPYSARPTAATHVWLTPVDILAGLGHFDLDPCAAPSPRPWPTAERHVELPEDGLAATWEGRVWCNPPFGKHTAKWLARMAAHNNGIALVFARTETRMFVQWVWRRAAAVFFLAGRPSFCRSDGSKAPGNSGGPICLIAYGEANVDAILRSGLEGALVRVAGINP